MKKIFFVSALLISATLMAQESINWFSAIESNASNGTKAVGASGLASISAYEDGSIVAAAKFASCGLEPATATWLDKSFVGAPFTVDQQTTNANLLISKISKDGEVQWLLHSNRGNGEAVAIATADGGALVFAAVGHTDSDVQGDHKNLQLLNGENVLVSATHDFKKKELQFGELVKVAADGESAVLAGELLNQGLDNDFTALNWATDGTNYYLLLIVKNEVKFGETTLTPFEGGSLAILKFNEDGELLGSALTDGKALTSTTSNLFCDGEKLYIGTVAAVDGVNSFLIETFGTDLAFVREDIIKGVVVNNKNVLQLKKVFVKDGAVYVAGAVNGGIELEGGNLENSANKNKAVVVKYDLAFGKATHAYLHGAGIGQISDMFTFGGGLFGFGYEMQKKDGEGIFFVQLDANNLAAKDTVGLFITAGTETTWNAVEADGNIVFAANTAANSDLKFTADESKSVKTTTLSRILASVTLKAPKDEPTAIENTSLKATKAQKVVRDGQIIIIRDGKTFNALGAQID